jgi:hypothetical protein
MIIGFDSVVPGVLHAKNPTEAAFAVWVAHRRGSMQAGSFYTTISRCLSAFGSLR